MRLEKYTKDNYCEISKWWNGHSGWSAVPEDVLPDTGFVVFDGRTPLAAGFIYNDTTSSLGMMEWIVANPENSARQSLKSLMVLIEGMTKYADSIGLKLYASIQNAGLEKLYNKYGFITTDKNMISMVRG